jgi:ribosomal protein S10
LEGQGHGIIIGVYFSYGHLLHISSLSGANISVPNVNGKKIIILFIYFRITELFMLTCGCIAFVGLIKIAIKKISYKKSVQPINVPTISAQVTESLPAIQSNEEEQDEFELQSNSRIINVAPIHLEEESVESLENIDMIQSLNVPIEINETNSIDVENPESEETPEMLDQDVLYFNNRKFNPNLISSTGLTFIFMIIFIVGSFFSWNLRFADDFEIFVFKTHIYYCLPIALPIGYFIVNPKHLISALKIVFDICKAM